MDDNVKRSFAVAYNSIRGDASLGLPRDGEESHFGSATAAVGRQVEVRSSKEEYVNFKVNRASLKWKLHLKLNRKNGMGWRPSERREEDAVLVIVCSRLYAMDDYEQLQQQKERCNGRQAGGGIEIVM